MRDPRRISVVLEQLEDLWWTVPDMRLGQLLVNLSRGDDLFNVEDDELSKAIAEAMTGTWPKVDERSAG